MNFHDDVLRRELERLMWPSARPGYAYRGPADFVLRHGEVHEPRPFPPTVGQGALRKCFGNAIAVALLYGLTYVEGFAMMPVAAGGEVVPHAWNRAPGGWLVDSTWLNTGAAYLGVPFSLGRADDATWNGDACVLDDLHRGWPLLRERWAGEDFDREWEPSPVLVAARARDRAAFDRLEAEAAAERLPAAVSPLGVILPRTP